MRGDLLELLGDAFKAFVARVLIGSLLAGFDVVDEFFGGLFSRPEGRSKAFEQRECFYLFGVSASIE